ncbi:MAG: hypothetical protein QOD30_577, partial [Actinomycetota bacterium]|nr:hypothetical protein [Actinomycetota bacterium]
MRRTPTFVLLAVLALLAQACGGGDDRSFTIGFKRLALDLSYKDETLPAPTRADVVTPQPVPSFAEFLNQVRVPPRLRSVAPSLFGPCASAPDDAHP